MTIRIRKRLRSNPKNIQPGQQLSLHQELSSTVRGGEKAKIVYSLDPLHNIWFENRMGEQSKTIERVEDVSTKIIPIEHNTRLVEAAGQPVPIQPGDEAAIVQIDQVITWLRGRAPRKDDTPVGILD